MISKQSYVYFIYCFQQTKTFAKKCEIQRNFLSYLQIVSRKQILRKEAKMMRNFRENKIFDNFAKLYLKRKIKCETSRNKIFSESFAFVFKKISEFSRIDFPMFAGNPNFYTMRTRKNWNKYRLRQHKML